MIHDHVCRVVVVESLVFARQNRIAHSQVDTTMEAQLSRGEKAGVGDTILARKNQS